jgi:hypothetical protein
MPDLSPRWVHDTDITAYAAYIAQRSALATPPAEAPQPFRLWFQQRHGAWPLEPLAGSASPVPAGLGVGAANP